VSDECHLVGSGVSFALLDNYFESLTANRLMADSFPEIWKIVFRTSTVEPLKKELLIIFTEVDTKYMSTFRGVNIK